MFLKKKLPVLQDILVNLKRINITNLKCSTVPNPELPYKDQPFHF